MHLLFELFHEQLGLPAGVLNLVHGDKAAVDGLLQHPAVRAISFVGSTPVAKYIYSEGAKYGKRVQAQGGAKNPIIVLPDAVHFQKLGVDDDQLRVTGNIKYDLTLPSGLDQQGRELRKAVFGRRLVWIAASTHRGEDELILEAFEQLRMTLPEVLLVLVPRHPERFLEVADLCRQRNLDVITRSAQQPCQATTSVFIGDSMGELLLLYAAADIAFIGGSLIRHGGHNILEPALLGLPVIFGPHMFNFSEASQQLLQNNAAWQVSNTQELVASVARLLRNDGLRRGAGKRARATVEANRGALAKLFGLVESLMQTEQRSRAQLRLNDPRAGKGKTGSEQRRLP
jgi:hypothetical protein